MASDNNHPHPPNAALGSGSGSDEWPGFVLSLCNRSPRMDSSWDQIGNGGYVSILCQTVAAGEPGLWKSQLETADFCISPQISRLDREELMNRTNNLYNDSWFFSVISMEDGMTFEHEQLLSVSIISAMGRFLNDKWLDQTRQIICLEVVDQDDTAFGSDRLLKIWGYGLSACKVNLSVANLVYIPFRVSGSYGLVVVNFTEEKIHYVYGDRVSDQLLAEPNARVIGSYFFEFMVGRGDPRGSVVSNFCYDRVNPTWLDTPQSRDSGVAVAHLMETFRGSWSQQPLVRLSQRGFRLKYRVMLCSCIINCGLNGLRHLVQKGVAQNMVIKSRA